MAPGILQQRDRDAQDRILAAVRKLAEGAELNPLLETTETVWDRDPAVRDMFKREALALLLEAIVRQRAARLDGAQVHLDRIGAAFSGVQATPAPNLGGKARREAAGVS